MKTLTNITNQKGVTLVELLLYLGLSAFLIVLLTELVVNISNLRLETNSYNSLETDTRYLTLEILNRVHNASSITTPANPGDVSATLVFINNGITYTYALVGTNLTLTDNTGTYILNNPKMKIISFSVKRLGLGALKGFVSVDMTLEGLEKVNGVARTKTYQFIAGRR